MNKHDIAAMLIVYEISGNFYNFFQGLVYGNKFYSIFAQNKNMRNIIIIVNVVILVVLNTPR